MRKKPYIIAEVGCNHKGQMDIAYEMIKNAAEKCKVDAVKFQKRCPKELLSQEQYCSPHPNPQNAYGKSYGEHREFLELNIEQHAQLKKWCEQFGLTYATSVWDMTSAKEIVSLSPQYIKIPSACNTNYNMLEWLCNNYEGEIHLSIGMTTQSEEQKIIELFEHNNRLKDLILFCCTSGYPVQVGEVCLLEISRLIQQYGKRVKDIGFSGHHLNTIIDVAALALGANYFERHYTLNRAWKGTDHAVSLEPNDFFELRNNLQEVAEALQYKKDEILAVEIPQRKKLKYVKKD